MNRAMCILFTQLALVCTASEAATPDAEPNKTGYPTVAAALEGVRAKPGTKMSVSDKWTTIEDMEGKDIVLWSFTQPGHPAHPSVVKRAMQAKTDGYYIDMNVRCEAADKVACSALVRSFQALNEKVRQAASEGK